MTQDQEVAYIHAQVACCNCEMEAMKVANLIQVKKGFQPKYNEKDFLDLPSRYGLHHNAVVSTLQG